MNDKERIAELEAELAELRLALDPAITPDKLAARKVFISLMREVAPDTVVLKTMSGDIIAQNVIDDLMKDGNNEGTQFIADLLRVSRDLMIRDVEFSKSKKPKKN